jgi:hypothetical protein
MFGHAQQARYIQVGGLPGGGVLAAGSSGSLLPCDGSGLLLSVIYSCFCFCEASYGEGAGRSRRGAEQRAYKQPVSGGGDFARGLECAWGTARTSTSACAALACAGRSSSWREGSQQGRPRRHELGAAAGDRPWHFDAAACVHGGCGGWCAVGAYPRMWLRPAGCSGARKPLAVAAPDHRYGWSRCLNEPPAASKASVNWLLQGTQVPGSCEACAVGAMGVVGCAEHPSQVGPHRDGSGCLSCSCMGRAA